MKPPSNKPVTETTKQQAVTDDCRGRNMEQQPGNQLLQRRVQVQRSNDSRIHPWGITELSVRFID